MLEYVDAWVERTEANDGLIPTSVGLDGKIDSGYGWYGGVYGWGFSVLQIPWRGEVAHRNTTFERPCTGSATRCCSPASGATSTSGAGCSTWSTPTASRRTARSSTRTCTGGSTGWSDCSRAATIDDLPRQGPEGWYEFRSDKFAPGRASLYYWTLDRSALDLLPETPRWVRYLDGEDESYPEEALQADLEDLRSKVERMRADVRTPDTTMSDDPNAINPATTDALVRLMLGGLPVGRTGYPLHCQLRYFDPARRRAGLPEQVGALVERITEEDVTVQLVNLDPVTERTVIVQGGAYAEHQITTVAPGGPRRVDGGRSSALRGPARAARRGTSRGRACSAMPTNRRSAFPGRSREPGIIDTHVHVWCRGKGPECRPSSTARIPIPSESVPVEWLIDDMERAGISYAVLVQSSAFGANNRYIVECVRSLSREVPRHRTGPPPRPSGSDAG